MEHIRFLTAAMKDRKVGALAPSSGASVRWICRTIDVQRPVTVVEYGPGTGVFTRHLLTRLDPGSTLLAIELNRVFAGRLRRAAKRRKRRVPRCVVINGDARNVRELLGRIGLERADYVVSGIPFSLLCDQYRREIVQRTYDVLAPSGRFILYQYSYLMRDYVKECFGDVRLGRCLLNFPPYCTMEASKAPNVVSGLDQELGRKRLEPAVLVDAGQR